MATRITRITLLLVLVCELTFALSMASSLPATGSGDLASYGDSFEERGQEFLDVRSLDPRLSSRALDGPRSNTRDERGDLGPTIDDLLRWKTEVTATLRVMATEIYQLKKSNTELRAFERCWTKVQYNTKREIQMAVDSCRDLDSTVEPEPQLLSPWDSLDWSQAAVDDVPPP